ncbi:MAG: hypothetical protein A3K19_25480 [Lentisphaerae bacterium RIFOXYB12_FULL_65_16]|nr:MAG: hypothetical protein A3K18_15275 [Lentisphaerae bacterium RIFOXYA12_64_32]OGV84885.1 MAG: hypothetical protein A3K19_25480 [Lentisphaerae bacterium RIFOXYB12_FULL_65_16]
MARNLFSVNLASLVLFTACGAVAQGPAESATDAAVRHPAVLFAGTLAEEVRPWHDWLDAGFEVDARQFKDIRSVADLKPFNVVVVQFVPVVDAQEQPQPEQLVFEKVLAEYLNQGGGVLVFCGGSGFDRHIPALQHLLQPYGATVPEEQVTDPGHVFGLVGGHLKGCYTTKIEPAPMTAGIQRLGYVGDASRADCIETMMPLVLLEPAAWHVVVRGEQTAYSAEGEKPGITAKLKDTPATYKEFPVLAAWRDVGAGRLLVHPQNPAFTTASPEVFENVLWNAADKTAPGAMQNRSFVMQAVRWAAEPTLASGAFGGFVTDRKFKPDARAILESPDKAIDWTGVATGDALSPVMHSQRGLVGARSTFSGAPHSVRELCDAAKAAGLAFLGFTEDLDKLTPETWEKIKAECDTQATATFVAIPGMLALDKIGNTWFALGWVAFPKVPALTPDLKRLDNTYMFWAQLFKNRLAGFGRTGRNPCPWYEMKQGSGFAVYTSEKGQPADDAEAAYLESCYDMENYVPFNLTLLTTPAELATAASGTVNVFTGPTAAAVKEYAQGEGAYSRDQFWASPHAWYLSSGPRLCRNGGFNLSNFATDEEKQNLFRYGFKLEGLQPGDRILLCDGPRPFREWCATADTFATEHTWPHEQVRQLIVRVVRDGKTVLLAAPVQLHYGRRFMQCGDRQNTLPYNYQPDEAGDVYVSGIPVGAHYRSWTPSTLVYGNFKVWLTGAVGIEYQPPMYMSFWTSPHIPFDHARNEGSTNLASYQHHRLSCPGMLIVDEITNRVYPDGGRHDGDCAPPKLTEPLQLFNLQQRRYAVYGMLSQVNGQYVESRIEALQDVALKGANPEIMVSRLDYPVKPGAGQVVELCTVPGRLERILLDAAPRVNVRDELKSGAYVGAYPYGLAGGGAQYAVSGDLVATLNTTMVGASFQCPFYLRAPARWAKGDTFPFAMLYTTGGSVPHRPASDYQAVVAFLGLSDGKFPAIRKVEGGRLLGAPVLATVEAEPRSTVRIETEQGSADPLGLPIRVRGLEPNWLVVYLLNDSKTWRYCGRLDGDSYFHLYTRLQPYTVTLGHPVWADSKELVISLDDSSGHQAVFEVYNPTAASIRSVLQSNPAFLPEKTIEVTVSPFSSIPVTF